jgi:hypothetical protein
LEYLCNRERLFEEFGLVAVVDQPLDRFFDAVSHMRPPLRNVTSVDAPIDDEFGHDAEGNFLLRVLLFFKAAGESFGYSGR